MAQAGAGFGPSPRPLWPCEAISFAPEGDAVAVD